MPSLALTSPDTQSQFSLVQAHQEGWTILEGCGPEHADTQLRGVTCSDQNAWWQVARKARQGSPYHREALSRLSHSEREQISLRFGPL
ncbi:hypothetical protein AD945_04585 [Gluconobacter albidus]|uniref:Uncharacterized protein n=2 Tax=Gluconobacter albidus TaxID=318683 RepID=A0A149TL92_9PROT|nr:hypothetical protein AD945_04585 [Gluconobacter albidus]